MNKTLVPSILLLIHVQLQALAQTPVPPAETRSPWSAGLLVGPAFPVGQFAGKFGSGNNSSAGFPIITGAGNAQTGLGAALSGGYRVSRSFGAALVVSGQENPVDAAAIAKFYQSISQVNGAATATSKHWHIIRLLAGGVYTRPLAVHGLSLQVRLLAGLLKTHSPAYSYFISTTTGGLSAEEGIFSGFVLPWTFCYQADAGLKWKWGDRLSLVVSTGYSGARPTWKNTYTSYSANGSPYRTTIKNTFPLGTLSVQAGLQILL